MSKDKLASIRLKFERSKQHVADLHRMLTEFYATNPYKVGTKHDPDTRKLIYYVSSVEDTPPAIPLIAGDALGGMISTLDHIVYGLFLKGGTGGRDRHLNFPIFDDFAKYKADSKRKVKGLEPAPIIAIDTFEPYKGGAGHEFWVLQELNNLSKHRELVTVGSMFRSVDLGAHLVALMEKQVGMPLPMMPAFFRPADPLCPLKAGDELFIDAPDAEVNNKIQFRFDVSLYEPLIAEPKPIIEAFHQFANLIESAIAKLEKYL
jgi:hypothetical protein